MSARWMTAIRCYRDKHNTTDQGCCFFFFFSLQRCLELIHHCLGLWMSAADKKVIFRTDGIGEQKDDENQQGYEIAHPVKYVQGHDLAKTTAESLQLHNMPQTVMHE